MTDARSAILGRLARTLGHGTNPDDPTVSQRLHEHPRGPLPQWPESVQDRFLAKLTKAAATHAELATSEGIVQAVAEYLCQQKMPLRLVTAPHPSLNQLPWPEDWQVEHRSAGGEDRVGLGVAFCGIAETGSLMLLSAPESPTALNFLPDDYLCLLQAKRIVPRLEDAWDLLRSEQGSPPRTVNIISGPSRTADVEQTIQLGAHGPRRLHVIVQRNS